MVDVIIIRLANQNAFIAASSSYIEKFRDGKRIKVQKAAIKTRRNMAALLLPLVTRKTRAVCAAASDA